MSGPKLSAAEIERRRQMELEAQRKAYLKALKEAQQAYRAACEGLCSQVQTVRAWMERTLPELERTKPDTAAEVRSEMEGLLTGLRVRPVSHPQSVEAYHSAAADMQEDVRKVLGQLHRRMEEEERAIRAAGQQLARMNREQQIGQALREVKQTAPAAPMRVDFSFDGAAGRLREQLLGLAGYLRNLHARDQDPKFQKLTTAGEAELTALANMPDLERRRRQVALRAEAINNAVQEYLRQKEALAGLYGDYCALAAASGVTPRPERDFHSEAELCQENRKLEERYRKQDEMDFIATQINEVMLQLGYTFVTSRALRRQDGTEYDASLYQADEQAGISIYTDESGAVMMQMTTLGDGAITQADVEESYQRQLDFCAAHPEIVAALAQRGVLLRAKHYEPPSRKYVKKQALVRKGSRTVVDRRGRRRHGKQKMYRMRGGE